MREGADARLGERMDGLSRLNRPATQQNDPLTEDYVNAGLSLVEEALNHDPDHNHEGHPFLTWISQRRVVETANQRSSPMRSATVASLRDRWQPHGNYLWDLIDHIRARRPSRSFPERARETIRMLLLSRRSAPVIVRELGRDVQEGMFDNELFRIQLLGLAVVGGVNFQASSAMPKVSGIYDEIDERWMGIIDRFLEKFDLQYRVGVKQSDLIQLGTALTEGFALRELADPTSGHRREERLRLHSTGLLSILYSLTLPRDVEESNQSIDKAVNSMIQGA